MRPSAPPKNEESPAFARLFVATGATRLEPATSGVTERGFATRKRCKRAIRCFRTSRSCHLFTSCSKPLRPADAALGGARAGRIEFHAAYTVMDSGH